ncbi:hypothetical protein ACKI2C_08330 [Streptomyces brasiliscabiei]|uniref:hypothetical protein n=1 Tax=Streptomyces brasiliscabiei TaxID=2736302 RepID=UPI0038F5E110
MGDFTKRSASSIGSPAALASKPSMSGTGLSAALASMANVASRPGRNRAMVL